MNSRSSLTFTQVLQKYMYDSMRSDREWAVTLYCSRQTVWRLRTMKPEELPSWDLALAILFHLGIPAETILEFHAWYGETKGPSVWTYERHTDPLKLPEVG